MAIHACDEYVLTQFYLEPGFHRAIVNEMRPWLVKINMIRNVIYKRATHTSSKEAWTWMKRYERMLVRSLGDAGRFLPDDEEKKNVQRAAAAGGEGEGDDEGFVTVPA